jgi:hypothetical protein
VDHRIGEPLDLVGAVRHVDHRDAGLVAQAFEVGQDLGLSGGIERGQRLVEQQEARLRQQRAPDRDPLLLAPRQVGRTALEKRGDLQEVEHLGLLRRIARASMHPAAEGEVLADRKVRKQPPVLKDVTDPAAMDRDRDAAFAVEQHVAVEHDPTAVGGDQAGDHIDDRCLAGARGAEQCGHAPRGVEGRFDQDRPEPLGDLELEHRRGGWAASLETRFAPASWHGVPVFASTKSSASSAA